MQTTGGGASGLAGYIYQQRYLTMRVLASLAGRLLNGYDASLSIANFPLKARLH
jgi:hypothetical protein